MSDTAPPTLRLVYLARLREAFGTPGEAMPLGDPGGSTVVTVATVLDALRARGGTWSHELAAGRAFRVAVNHEMASPATPVRAGDELAIFPPVTGG